MDTPPIPREGSCTSPLGIAVLAGITVIITTPIVLFIYGLWYDTWMFGGKLGSGYHGVGECTVLVLPVEGEIYAYGASNEYVTTNTDDVLRGIEYAEADRNIRAILVHVDSYGGSPYAADTISRALRGTMLPVVATVGEAAVSAGYLIASGADTIIASPFSDIGGLGLTMSYLEYSQQHELDGVTFVPLRSARYKDYGNPDTPLASDERALLERDLAIFHEVLVGRVAELRGLDVESVRGVADGSMMAASLALEAGLIDALGGREEATMIFAEELGLEHEDVVYCQYVDQDL